MNTTPPIKTILPLAAVAAVFSLAPAAQADAVVFSSSTQLNLAGGNVLAAVSLWDPNRTNEGQSTVGTIQGVDFDDIDFTTQDTGADIALNSGEAGATLAISSIAQSVGREWNNANSLVGTFSPASADNTQAELWPSGALFQSNGTTTFTFGFGAGRANTAVEVQAVGGGVWNRQDKWGLLTFSVDGDDKDILNDRGTPDLITFSALTDGSGDLAVVVTQTPGGSGTDRQWNVLGGMTVTAGPSSSQPFAITEIDYDPDAGNLRIRWDSQDGRLYNLRSESDPSVAAPIDWPIFDGHQDLAATPPENTLTFPLPADSERFFVIEGFPAPPVSVLSEDFESGQGDWVPGNSGVPLPDPPGGVSSPTATVWELGTPDPVLLGGPPAAHSGTNCFGTDLDTSYADSTGVFLRSPSINLTTAAGATLTFWRFYDIETGFDWGRVRVLDAADDSEIAVLEETFDGTTNDWEEVSIKLPAEVAGKMVKIEFILATDDVTNNPQAGLYIDDVSVTVP